ncbi:MAG: hypothetical protein ACRDHL_09555, partial [Candidatus Promineifilaceae bacterium]
PKTVLSMETLLEKVLETEGVTPEMLARQKAQARLLDQMMGADEATTDQLVKEWGEMVDATFFALLRTLLNGAEAAGREADVLRLINLQAKLYRQTDYGRRREKQEQAVGAFSREARKKGLSAKLLLEHVLANRDDDMVVDALVAAGGPALNYDFFMQLSERIEKRERAGVKTDQLVALRERLLKIREEIEEQSRQALAGFQAILDEILDAEDKQAAVRENIGRMDESFLTILAAMQSDAQRRKDYQSAAALSEVQTMILAELEEQTPPPLRLLNSLLGAEDEEERRAILAENEGLLTPETLELIRAVGAEAEGSADPVLLDRLRQIEAMIAARMPA